MQQQKDGASSRITRGLAQTAVRLGLRMLLALAGLVVLHRIAGELRWSEVKADIAATPAHELGLAVLATTASLAAVSLCDVLALRGVSGQKIPARFAAMTGAASFAVSNLIGFAWLTGTTVRLRIYQALGLRAGQIAQVVVATWLAQIGGISLLLGGLLLAHPVGISKALAISPLLEDFVGLVILGLIGVGLIWLGKGPRILRFGTEQVALPASGTAIPMIGVALLDVLCASLVLYALLPADAVPNFAVFFAVFVGAVTLGIASNAPGGLGVFEATVMVGLGAMGRHDVLAALLLYRLIYSVLPFVIASLCLAVVWIATRSSAKRAGRLLRAAAMSAAPVVAAGVALVAGMTLLLSGSLPGADRPGLLRHLVSLPFFEASHLIGSIAGAVLIVLMRGLSRKLFRAWLAAMGLLATGLLAVVLKGPDWPQAGMLLVSLCMLGLFRPAFYREDGRSIFRQNSLSVLSAFVLLGSTFWVGMLAHSHVAYRDALWWEFAWSGDASRFLRASLGVAVVILILSANALITARGPRIGPEPIPQTVRDLLAQCPDADAQIALSGDKAFLVSPDKHAFLPYADTGSALIANGDPVGDPAAGAALIWQLREHADRSGRSCAYYGVAQAYLPTYLDLGLQILKIGEFARVDLQSFNLDGPRCKDFRYAINRAARDGYVFEIIPAARIGPHFARLKVVSDAWLEAKQGQEKAFVMGAFDVDYLSNFDHAVLRESSTGTILAFANILQGAKLHELSIDLMRHDPEGPKFAMDALLGNILLWAKAKGFAFFALGAVPLAGLQAHRLASIWNRIGGFIYAHGEHFYHFEGLRAFKQKFDPVWTPHYLASPSGLAVPRVLYDVNVLISGGMIGVRRKG